jgi:hypothetical protein
MGASSSRSDRHTALTCFVAGLQDEPMPVVAQHVAQRHIVLLLGSLQHRPVEMQHNTLSQAGAVDG